MIKSIYKQLYSLCEGIRFGAYGSKLRVFFLRKFAGSVGNNVFIGPRVTIVHPELLHVGSNISIHQDCYIDCSGTVTIGDDVSIAHNTSIVSFNHTYTGHDKIRNNKIEKAPIIIEGDVWLGCKTTLLPGITLHPRTIVAAGAVVNKSMPGNAIVGGVPAKVIKDITSYENK